MLGRKETVLSKLRVIFKADPVCGHSVFLIPLFLNFGLTSVISKHTSKHSSYNNIFLKKIIKVNKC